MIGWVSVCERVSDILVIITLALTWKDLPLMSNSLLVELNVLNELELLVL